MRSIRATRTAKPPVGCWPWNTATSTTPSGKATPGRSAAIVARALSVLATMSAGPPVWRDGAADAMSANTTGRAAVAQPARTKVAKRTYDFSAAHPSAYYLAWYVPAVTLARCEESSTR